MTTEQKKMLLELVEEKSDKCYPYLDYESWNDIYWQIVKIETEDESK